MRFKIFILILFLLLGTYQLGWSERTHTIEKGDTLFGLGRKYGIPYVDIFEANPRLNPRQLKIGDKIIIPEKKKEETPPSKDNSSTSSENTTSEKKIDQEKPSSTEPQDKKEEEKTHTVVRGDTLSKISKTYSISVDQLKELNHLKSNLIRVGDKLKISLPSKKEPPKQEEVQKPDSKSDPETTKSETSSPQKKDETKKEDKTTEEKDVKKIEEKEVENKNKSSEDTSSNTKKDEKESEEKNSQKTEKKNEDQQKSDSSETSSNKEDQEEKLSKKDKATEAKEKETSSDEEKPTRKPSNSNYIFISKVKKQMESPRRYRKWKYIVVHNSGTSSGNAKIFDYYHANVRGMENGLAYHFVIGNGTDSGDGEIEVGSRWLRQIQGGHLASDYLNEISVGICLVGDFNKSRPTKRQIASLVELINYLNTHHSHPKFKVHREINTRPTDCPGKYFPAEAMHKIFG